MNLGSPTSASERAAMSTATSTLTAEDLEFLARPLHGFLTVAEGPQPPQPRPVWFEATADGTIQFFTAPDSLKVRRLRRDPRASIVVAAPVGERERWVSVAGRTRWRPTGRTTCAHASPPATGTSTTRSGPPISLRSWPTTRSASSSTRRPCTATRTELCPRGVGQRG